MDKQYRLFGKLSLLDLLLAVLVVCVAVGGQMLTRTTAAQSGQALTFTVELSRQEEGFSQQIHIGQALYDNLKGIYLGQIAAVEATPYLGSSDDLTAGVRRQAPVEGLESVLVTVQATGAQKTGPSTVVNDYELAVGKEMFVRSADFSCSGYCVSMKWEGQ